MSETKAAPAKEQYEYITIPDRDLFDNPMHSFWLNKNEYKPGTHFVPAPVAAHLRERLEIFNRQQIRLMQPGVDKKALRDSDANRPAGASSVVDGQALDRVFA